MNPDTGEVFEFCNSCGQVLRVDGDETNCHSCGAALGERRKKSVIEEHFGDAFLEDLQEHIRKGFRE